MALQDTDNFIVGRDEESYKISYQELKDELNIVPPPTGIINTPQVISPEDGAGSGELRYLNSDTITKVEGGGENVYATDTIASVNGNVLTFPTDNNFDKFEVGDVVQTPYVIASIDAAGPTITTDGGSWLGADGTGDVSDGRYEPSQEWSSIVTANSIDSSNSYFLSNAFDGSTATLAGAERNYPLILNFGSLFNTPVDLEVYSNRAITVDSDLIGTADGWIDCGNRAFTIINAAVDVSNNGGNISAIKINGKILVDSSIPGGAGDTDITKTVAYDTKLTVASEKDLADMSGAVYMTDGRTEVDGSYIVADYTPQTSTITNVSQDANPVLSFATSNPDLQYFQAGDKLPKKRTGPANNTVLPSIDGLTITNGENCFSGDINQTAYFKSTITTGGQTRTVRYNFTDTPVVVDSTETICVRLDNPFTGDKGKWNTFNTPSGTLHQATDFSTKPAGQSGTWVSIGGAFIATDNVISAFQGYCSLVNSSTQYIIGAVVVIDTETKAVKRVVDNTMQVPIEVVDVDVAANTMTVDGGTFTAGEVIDGPTNTAEGTFLSADGTEVSMTDSTGRWIADNKAGRTFSIAGPSRIDNPLLTADITLVSSEFSTTPADQDTLTNAKWTITKQGGTTEVIDAGAVTTFKPALGTFEPNSTYTVSVQYEGFNLDPSAQSTSVTFTTGATRTVYDRVRLLQARIDALEANEVSDDAVASSLITLIGSLNARLSVLENPEN